MVVISKREDSQLNGFRSIEMNIVKYIVRILEGSKIVKFSRLLILVETQNR